MQSVKNTGITIFLIGLAIFSASTFLGTFSPTTETIKSSLSDKEYANMGEQLTQELAGKSFSSATSLGSKVEVIFNATNAQLKKDKEWGKVMYSKPGSMSANILSQSATGLFSDSIGLMFLLTFGLGIIGALMYILPDVVLLGPPGIKNNGLLHSKATNRGWIGMLAFGYLVGFYLILYFYPIHFVNQIKIVSPISELLGGRPASRWFLYGFLYTTVMTVMAVKMYIKYRNNTYQIVRTTSVLFFQIAFAFLIPEIMAKLNQPSMDLKNAWPLNYTFFFDWNIKSLTTSGNMGMFLLVWGITLTVVIVPVFVYFFGKRWYCSWVCGCGGLAETLGDPYRHLSNKKLYAWKIERYLIHGVLVFAIVMTAATLYTYFTGSKEIVGLASSDLRSGYSFLIGSMFAGVIGTGFYPMLGNRAWCRFGCPLAAYLGLVQRFKSRFRITTNGGQCISCGNCSTYCEQGIDVRAYAQRGENIVRSSCVGCGVCSAVCPRGVLKLENGPEKGRISFNKIA